jgi:hypothetical protein
MRIQNSGGEPRLACRTPSTLSTTRSRTRIDNHWAKCNQELLTGTCIQISANHYSPNELVAGSHMDRLRNDLNDARNMEYLASISVPSGARWQQHVVYHTSKPGCPQQLKATSPRLLWIEWGKVRGLTFLGSCQVFSRRSCPSASLLCWIRALLPKWERPLV